MLIAIVAGGCESPQTRSSSALAPSPWNKAAAARREALPIEAVAAPTPQERWRPEWWGEHTLRDDGLVTVWAMAEDADLLAARARAVAAAEAKFVSEMGRRPRTLGTMTDSVRLESGAYRAFVRLDGVPM